MFNFSFSNIRLFLSIVFLFQRVFTLSVDYQESIGEHFCKNKNLLVNHYHPHFYKKSIYISHEVSMFLNEVLSILQEKSLHSSKIDWANIENELYASSRFAMYDFLTYSSVKQVLSKLLEQKTHSYFISLKKNDYKTLSQERDKDYLNQFESYIIEEEIAYLKIPSISSMNLKYVEKIQNYIKQYDSLGISKWIIDLRNNHGGNCWPMLQALGPFWLGTTLGYFGNEKEIQQTWFYDYGKVGVIEKGTYMHYSSPYILKNSNPNIAILFNENTASSGEVIAVAFSGQENTRSFGNVTAGYTTGIASYTLRNGTRLCVTGSYFFNRHKKIYKCGISPDEQVEERDKIDASLIRATEWLKSGVVDLIAPERSDKK